MRAARLPNIRSQLLVLAVAGFNVLLASALVRGETKIAFLLVALPVLVLVSELLVARREWLVFAALALAIAGGPLNGRLPGTGGTAVYPADVLVLLALAGYVLERLRTGSRERAGWPRTAVLSWPLALFAGALLIGVVRGHDRYGTSYVSQPTRMFIYVAIAGAIASLTPRRAHAGLVVIFYVGTVWQAIVGVYGLATGTSQTKSIDLSTGGTRALALSTAIYLAAALVLALLNLEIERSPRRRRLHLAIAGLATFGIVIAFGRTTFAALAVLIPILLLGLRHMRRRLLAYVPLLLPVVALLAALAVQLEPSLGSTLQERLTGRVSSDLSLIQRQRKFDAALAGIGDEPLLGLGFGRTVQFVAVDRSVRSFSGDPENSYVYVLAGGGGLALGALIVLMGTFFVDSARRLLHARGTSYVLIAFGMSLAFVFFVNALTGPIFSDPTFMLTIWIAMLLPAVARQEPEEDAAAAD